MTKVEPLNDAAFLLNGIPLQRGAYRIEQSGNLVGIVESQSESIRQTALNPFTEYVDFSDNGFADVNSLLLYLGNNILI